VAGNGKKIEIAEEGFPKVVLEGEYCVTGEGRDRGVWMKRG
jgi:hypothetical protein